MFDSLERKTQDVKKCLALMGRKIKKPCELLETSQGLRIRLFPQSWVESIAQAVAEQVVAEHGEHNG